MVASMCSPRCFIINLATFPLSHLTPSRSSSAINLKMEVSADGASDAKATSIGSSTTITAPNNTESDPLIQYVVLRRDLIDKWALGSVVTQGCHASVAAICSFKDDPYTLQYCNLSNLDAMRKVTLEVKGEAQIVNLSEKLNLGGIAHKLWIEQPENVPTCIATKPYPKSIVSSFFRRVKLCK